MMTTTQTTPVQRSHFDIESTEKFAQFLSGQSFQVINDPNAHTASWNVKSKVLTLPVWENCSNYVWDMLTAHEVGHVLFTPSNCFERAIKEIDPKRPNLSADIMNIVEDIREEKKMLRKYPGLGPTWYYGYKELLENGRLGLPTDIDERKEYLSKADVCNRFNTEAKWGQLGLLSRNEVPFSDEEREVYDLCIDAETFDDVMVCGVKLLELMKKEYQDKTGKSPESMPDSPSKQTTNPMQVTVIVSGKGSPDGAKAGGTGKGETSKTPMSSTGVGLNRTGSKNDPVIGGESSKIVNMNLSELLAAEPKNTRANTPNYTYIAKMPENLAKKIVYPCDKFHDLYLKSLTVGSRKISAASLEVLRANSKAYFAKLNMKVAFMAQDFDRRKAAAEHSRTLTHDTGVLDTKKLHKVSFSENVFLSHEIQMIGKNHGLCMYVDWSSSMSDKIVPTMEQVMTLIAFCRRVNLPYRVYLISGSSLDQTNYPTVSPTDRRGAANLIDMDGCSLFEVLSSARGSKCLDDIANAMSLAFIVSGGRQSQEGINRLYSSAALQSLSFNNYSFGLTGTPLHGAMWAMPTVSNAFAADHKLEVVSTIILSDGESNSSNFPNSTNNTTEIAVDPATGSRENLGWSGSSDVQTNLMNVLAKRIRYMTKGSVLGFYMMSPSYDHWYDSTAHIVLPTTELQKRNAQKDVDDFAKNKFLSVTSKGFDSYFFISTAKEKSTGIVSGSLDAIIRDNKAADRQIATQFVQRITNAWSAETKMNLGR